MGSIIFICTTIILFACLLLGWSMNSGNIASETEEKFEEGRKSYRMKARTKKIIEEVRGEKTEFLWSPIDRFSGEELIRIADQLNKVQLKKWYKFHHEYRQVRFPPEALTFILAKIDLNHP